MAAYRFRLVNVFATEPLLGAAALAGNPLCVFEDARGMDDRVLMALTRQFNLSETTFLLPPSPAAPRAHARVRIFTPTHDPKLAEMRFAGHPTLGSAHVVRDLVGCGDEVLLELPAGQVPVQATADTWTLTAPFDGEPKVHQEPMPGAALTALLGLASSDLDGDPLWVDTGMEQLLVPLRSVDAVRNAIPRSADDWPRSRSGRRNIYAFAFSGDSAAGRRVARARFFIKPPGNGLYEDPGTGSACANLGGWLLHTGADLPAAVAVEQGREMERPCLLQLDVGADRKVRVGGRVVEVARGEVMLP
jgi:trans-2,3-dihydro-3-hydroxyanthranilate isomerase